MKRLSNNKMKPFSISDCFIYISLHLCYMALALRYNIMKSFTGMASDLVSRGSVD